MTKADSRQSVRRLTDVVPSWLFVMRRPAHRLATAVAVNLVLALPLLFLENPVAFRLGAAYVLAVLVAAALGGSWTATVAGALSLISFWYFIVPPAHSFRLEHLSSVLAVVSMTLVVGAITAMTRGLERALAEIRALDARNTAAIGAERTARHAAESSQAESDRIARTLATTLLPPKLPQLVGFESAAWIHAASTDSVAGDFYDLFVVPGGWVAIMGDVQGKGAEAAAVTSLARYAARVAALNHPDPAHVMTVVNDALLADASDRWVTLAVIFGETRSQPSLQVSLAGHPKPRLLSQGGVVRLGHHNEPLGLWSVTPAVTSYPVDIGDTIVLFTDGLLEYDGLGHDDTLDSELSGLAGHPARCIAETLQTRLTSWPVRHLDDVALLAISRIS